jgi:hypothetical protein
MGLGYELVFAWYGLDWNENRLDSNELERNAMRCGAMQLQGIDNYTSGEMQVMQTQPRERIMSTRSEHITAGFQYRSRIANSVAWHDTMWHGMT